MYYGTRQKRDSGNVPLESGKYGALAMTSVELDTFIATTDQLMLASLRKDGSPFVIPVGFDWDGTSFFVTMGHQRGGVHRLRRDPRVSLCAASNPAFPTKFFIAEGIAHELDDPDSAVSRGVLLRASRDSFDASGIDTEQIFRELDRDRSRRVPHRSDESHHLRRHQDTQGPEIHHWRTTTNGLECTQMTADSRTGEIQPDS